MPRQPRTEFTVVPQLPANSRPEPPPNLTERERELWSDIVGSMPPHHFGAQVTPLLRQLIVHIVNAEFLGAAVRQIWATTAPVHFTERFHTELQGQLVVESKIIAELSHKLRLTPAARTTLRAADFARRNTPQVRPWEDDDDDGAA